MAQWGFYFDQSRCIGCKACVLACKAWNHDGRGDRAGNEPLSWMEDPGTDERVGAMYHSQGGGRDFFSENARYSMKEDWRRVDTLEEGEDPEKMRFFNLSLSCNHCSEPPCAAACPTAYIFKESERGIVLIDESKRCVSCKRCRAACPWGAPQFYSDGPGIPMTKCDFCLGRIAEGLKPACVAACVARALDAGPMEDLHKNHPEALRAAPGFDPDKASPDGSRACPNILFKPSRRR